MVGKMKLANISDAPLPERIGWIIFIVAQMHGYSVDDILSRRRPAPLVEVRQATYAYARRITKASYPKLGEYFDRSHDVIMRGIKRHYERIGQGV